MNDLCVRINNGYRAHYKTVEVKFKKIYIFVLLKLKSLNYINSFIIKGNKIIINLRYYNNKPLFFLKLISTSGNNIFYRLKKVKKLYLNQNLNTQLLFTSNGCVTLDEAVWLNKTGLAVIEVQLLSKNME